MKKSISGRKLHIHAETITRLTAKVLSLDELRDNKVVGASEPNCGGTGCGPTQSGSQTK